MIAPRLSNRLRILTLSAVLLQLALVACCVANSWQQSNEIAAVRTIAALDRTVLESAVMAHRQNPLHLDDNVYGHRARVILNRTPSSRGAGRNDELVESVVNSCKELQYSATEGSHDDEFEHDLARALNRYLTLSKPLLVSTPSGGNVFLPLMSVLALLTSVFTVLILRSAARQVSSEATIRTISENLPPSSLDRLALSLTGTLTIGTKSAKSYLDNMPVGLLTADSNGVIQSANLTALKMLHCTIDKVAGCNLDTFFRLPGRKAPSDLDALKEISSDKAAEMLLLRRDGEPSTQLPVDVSLAEFSGPGGQGVIVNIIDISDRHEVEKLKQEFLSVVSHDLRTPLTAIALSLGSILSSNENEPLTAEQRSLARNAEREAGRLIRLVSTLLDFARIRSGKMELQKRPFDVEPFLQRVCASMSTVGEPRAVAVLGTCETDFVVADEDRIHQVLENLIGNSIKFSPAGSAVSVRAYAVRNAVKFEVKDEGPGIPEDKHEVIFERFAQLSGEDRTVRGGAGLGLAICKLMIEQHGGNIGVESQEGKGSCFWFTLPD